MDQPGQIGFRSRLRQAGRRINANLLLEEAALAALVAGLVAVAVVLCQRAFSVRPPLIPGVAVLAAVAAAYVLVRWWLRRPSLMQIALAIDERLALRERFSTTLAVSRSEDPFAAAVREETYARLPRVDVARHFPIRLSRCWTLAAAGWAAAALLVLYMPPLDLLGREVAEKKAAAEEKRLEEARATVKQEVTKIEAMVKQLGAAEMAAELAKLNEAAPGAPPAEIRRQAIRALGELPAKLQQSQAGERAEAAQALQQMMKQLKLPSQGLSRDLAKALARGEFGAAADLIRKMQERLAQRDLKPEEREALAKELAELAKQMARLAEQMKQMEDALEKAGLDKKLANLDEDALRRALEKAGLDAKDIQKLIDKARACRTASANCKALGQALAACSSGTPGLDALSPDALASLAGQLDSLEAMRQQLALMNATLDEIESGMAMLGMGMGAMGLFDLGDSSEQGAGSGGPGKGSAPVQTAESGDFKTSSTRVRSPAGAGPSVGTWYEQEEQIKGESQRQAQETLQAAKDRAAEAVSENRIPSRYHGAVKQYFGDLDKKPGAGK
jgi:hypothetical protein